MSAGLATSRQTKPFKGMGSHSSDVEDGELNDGEVAPKIANFESRRAYEDNLSRRLSEKDRNHEPHLFNSQDGHRKRPRSPPGSQSNRHNYESPSKMPQSEPSRFSLNSTTTPTMATMPKDHSHRDTTISQLRESSRFRDDNQVSSGRTSTYTTSCSSSKRPPPEDDRLRSKRGDLDRLNTSRATADEGRYRDHSPSSRDRKPRDEYGRGSRGIELVDFASSAKQQRSHRGVTEREMCNPRVDRHHRSSYAIDRNDIRSYEDRKQHHEDTKPGGRGRFESQSTYSRTSDSIRRPEYPYGRHEQISSSAPRRSSQLQELQPSRYDPVTRKSRLESNTTSLSSSIRGRDVLANESSDMYATREGHTNFFTSRYASRVQEANAAKFRPRSRSPSPLASSLRGVGRRSSYEGNASRAWEISDRSRHETSSRSRKIEEKTYESRPRPSSPSRASWSRYDNARSSTSRENDIDSSTRRKVGAYASQLSDRGSSRFQSDFRRRSPSPTMTAFARDVRRDSYGNDSSSARRVLHDPILADTVKSARTSYYDSKGDAWDRRDRTDLSRQPERELSATRRSSIDVARSIDRKAARSPSPPSFSASLHIRSARKSREIEGRLHHHQQHDKRDMPHWKDSYPGRNEKYADSSLDATSLMNTSELYKEDRDIVRSKFSSDNWRQTAGDEKKDEWHDSRVERQWRQDHTLKSDPASKSLGSRWCPPSPARKPAATGSTELYNSARSSCNTTSKLTRESDDTHSLRNEPDIIEPTAKTRGEPDVADVAFSTILAPVTAEGVVVERILSDRDSSRRASQSGRPYDTPTLTRPTTMSMDSGRSSMAMVRNSNGAETASSQVSTSPDSPKETDSRKYDSMAGASSTSSQSNVPSVALKKTSPSGSKQTVVKKQASPKSSLGIPMKWLKPAARPPKKNTPSNKQRSSVFSTSSGAAMNSSLTGVKYTPKDARSYGRPGVVTKSNKHTDGSLDSKEGATSANGVMNKRISGEIESELVSDPEKSCPPRKRAKQMEKCRSSSPVSSAIHRTVTDSEGGSTVSIENRVIPSTINGRNEADMAGATPELTLDDSLTASMDAVDSKKRAAPSVPSVIVKKKNTGVPSRGIFDDDTLLESPSHPHSRESSASSSDVSNSGSEDDDSDTDDEEVMMWASKMFGLSQSSPQDARPMTTSASSQVDKKHGKKPKLHLRLSQVKTLPSADQSETFEKQQQSNVVVGKKEIVKKAKKKKKDRLMDRDGVGGAYGLGSSARIEEKASLKKDKKMKKKLKKILREKQPQLEEEAIDEAAMVREMAEDRRKREMAKPLTAAQIRAILGDDWDGGGGADGSGWVRRSTRQPLRSFLNSNQMQAFLHKLKSNDSDMVVLKMKKYISDPNVPQVVIDAALDALELNTNCEALYIQNFNNGMKDDQVLHLIRILQQPSCKIWCLNIGETYNVSDETWEEFTKGLKRTKVTHMYASEHTITGEMKDEIRETIRRNRSKHNRHIDPNNLDVIAQCTHCWWNPINAKVLRPYIKKSGYEHMLHDREAQGLKGSSSEAPVI